MTGNGYPKVNIVIPMAGEGSRFVEAGYTKPKPFIDVGGEPMISRVIDNLYVKDARHILIARRKHADLEPELVTELSARTNLDFVFIDPLTEGTACTVLEAECALDPNVPMVVANSDQLIVGGIAELVEHAINSRVDGSIMVFPSPPNPKWSYAKVDKNMRVQQVAEKVPISNLATVGVYYFRTAKIFSSAARAMIAAEDRVNNEFYTCPVYNYLIAQDSVVDVYQIEPEQMIGLGTPKDLRAFMLRKFGTDP